MKRNTVSNQDSQRVTLEEQEIQALRNDDLEHVGGGAAYLPNSTLALKNPFIYGIPVDFFDNMFDPGKFVLPGM